MVALQQDDVIRQPPEAAQHHIFIARQPFAGPQRRLPFALQNRDVIEHLGVEFAGRVFDIAALAIMSFPTARMFNPNASNAGGLNAV